MPRAKEFNEEIVLQKAVDLFWKKGYNATSMDDLVAHLGINRASLYTTFGGKKQLFCQALQKYLQSNTILLSHFFQDKPSIKEAIKDFFKIAGISMAADSDLKGCFAVNTSTELLPYDENLMTILSNNKSNFEAFFEDLLNKGLEKEEFKKSLDVKATAAFLVTFFNGLKVIAKINPKEEDLQKIIKVGLQVLD